MSVILQPYQALPFNTSLDFQTSRLDGGSLCTFENLIDEGSFIPFAIVSPDETVGNIEVYNCSDEWVQSLTLTITSVQDIETGLWFHYYNGDNIGLTCGTYYLTILVGDLIWYSEQFTIRDIVNASQYPELIKDDYHLPLRIYDSITKQLINKTDIACGVQPLNPVSTIMPFMFDTDEDISELDVYLVDACTSEETDLSADLELEFIKENPGGLVEEEVLTTSQQLRNEYYEFDSRNFVFQEIKINDTGKLKNILFKWYFGGESQTITIDLILGTNPSGLPVITKTITDNSATSKELTLDYFLDDLDVIAGQVYILKFSTDAECSASISVNSVKIYADGRFAERNTIALFKDQTSCISGTPYITGSYMRAVYSKQIGNECFGDLNLPANPGLYCYRYTANENQAIRIHTNDIQGIADGEFASPVNVIFTIKKNSTVLYSFAQVYFSYTGFTIPDQTLYVQMASGDNISVLFEIIDPLGNIFANSIDTGTIAIDVYHYGQVIAGTYIPTGYIPLGTNYQNKSLWFYVNITKEVYVGGTGATIVYNPARPLPSPLICGNYYLKLVSSLHTWYSEWFRIINVGAIDLTQFVLGTEDGEIIIVEDESSIIEI